MDNRPVLFIDSGIGGLPYCKDFINKNPQEEVCYLADRKNFPYGPRGKEELISILISLTEKLKETIDPKIIVLACNTATVSALDPLRSHFPEIPFVGTVPAIKPAIKACETGKVGVLGTARTIEDPYNQHIVQEYMANSGGKAVNQCEILGIAAPELVKFIEQRLEKSDENEKKEIVKKYIDMFRAGGADTLVLGCTHFLFLLEEFKREASNPAQTPVINIFDSLDGITRRIEYLLDEKEGTLRADKNRKPVHRLLLTGIEPLESSWQNRARTLDFTLCMVDEQ
ncbi:MAG: glutamate racemase [Treponema sp.]|nr:glutamate racemase [Treponema sp.]